MTVIVAAKRLGAETNTKTLQKKEYMINKNVVDASHNVQWTLTWSTLHEWHHMIKDSKCKLRW